jgi:hypothetical protein
MAEGEGEQGKLALSRTFRPTPTAAFISAQGNALGRLAPKIGLALKARFMI